MKLLRSKETWSFLGKIHLNLLDDFNILKLNFTHISSFYKNYLHFIKMSLLVSTSQKHVHFLWLKVICCNRLFGVTDTLLTGPKNSNTMLRFTIKIGTRGEIHMCKISNC